MKDGSTNGTAACGSASPGDALPTVCFAPIAGRCVIFATTDFSYHGHPLPLACPPDRSRRSIALYYYSAARPESELSREHSTLYLGEGCR